ncbi:MAG: hypothetical protein IPM85_16850 [Chitinophagaceae bacterium]|nr:hypothetical protein [Chitinophagaceae bacterium]
MNYENNFSPTSAFCNDSFNYCSWLSEKQIKRVTCSAFYRNCNDRIIRSFCFIFTGIITFCCNSGAYTVTLESRNNINGNWEWIWSVQNSNPGNGNNGTVQDLSHWGMQFGSCFNWSSVVSAAFSADGITWVLFSPVYASDPSQSCMTVPVLKFDFGTTGSAKSYYKLVVNQNFVIEQTPAYYKSGSSTGCCTFSFSGIGCSLEVDEPR